jgi:3-isopropylmalate/(R)-2-methylmalate dehydratase small subunit
MPRAWIFGNDVSTDNIIPGRFNISSNPSDLLPHVFQYFRPEFATEVTEGDIIIGGSNFGCGSSREHAAIVLKACGITLIAESYGWIFKRNCINTGLLPIESANKLVINDGNQVEIDMAKAVINDITEHKTYKLSLPPHFIFEIYREGGLINYLNTNGNYPF